MSDGVAGYWLDSTDGMSDIFVCKGCVEAHDKSTNRPLDVEAYTLLPIRCGFHLLGGKPEDYV